jgi:hypothetical protein
MEAEGNQFYARSRAQFGKAWPRSRQDYGVVAMGHQLAHRLSGYHNGSVAAPPYPGDEKGDVR